MINAMNQAIVRYATGKNVSITVIDQPWPTTYQEKEFQSTAQGFVAAFIFSIGLSFIPASIVSFIVKERVDMVKHQQLVSSVSPFTYWLSNYIVDMLKHMVPAIFCAGMAMAFNLQNLTQNDNYGMTWAFFIGYGLAILPYTYLISWLFTDYGNA